MLLYIPLSLHVYAYHYPTYVSVRHATLCSVNRGKIDVC